MQVSALQGATNNNNNNNNNDNNNNKYCINYRDHNDDDNNYNHYDYNYNNYHDHDNEKKERSASSEKLDFPILTRVQSIVFFLNCCRCFKKKS